MDSADSSDFVWNCDVPRVQDLDLWSVHLVSNCTHSDVKDGQDSHNIFSTPKLFSFASLCTFSGTTMWRRIHLQYEAFSQKLNQWSWLISADCFFVYSEMYCETIWTKSTIQQMPQHAVLPELPHPNLLGKFAIAANYEASPQTDLDYVDNFYITYM